MFWDLDLVDRAVEGKVSGMTNTPAVVLVCDFFPEVWVLFACVSWANTIGSATLFEVVSPWFWDVKESCEEVKVVLDLLENRPEVTTQYFQLTFSQKRWKCKAAKRRLALLKNVAIGL